MEDQIDNGKIEAVLFKSADKLRKNIDAAEYKHVVLGLIFLKHISDSFEELYKKLASGEGEYEFADPEDIQKIADTYHNWRNPGSCDVPVVEKNTRSRSSTLPGDFPVVDKNRRSRSSSFSKTNLRAEARSSQGKIWSKNERSFARKK